MAKKKKAEPATPAPPASVDLYTPGRLVIKRADAEHGHLYSTPDGEFWGATTFIGVLDKPVLKFWYASQERTFVTEAAAQLWDDAPRSTNRLAFLTMLKARTQGVKAAQRELEKAQEIGTQAHALVEWELRRELGLATEDRPNARPEALWSYESWETWRRSVDLEPLWVEQVVYSKTHGYAGTVDLIARLDVEGLGRVLAVVDWKTSKRHYPESSLQAAAYSYALAEMGHTDGGTLAPGLVIRLPKIKSDPGFEPKVVPVDRMPRHFAAFLAAKEAWSWLREEEAYIAAAPVPESLEEVLKKAVDAEAAATVPAGELLEVGF